MNISSSIYGGDAFFYVKENIKFKNKSIFAFRQNGKVALATSADNATFVVKSPAVTATFSVDRCVKTK